MPALYISSPFAELRLSLQGGGYVMGLATISCDGAEDEEWFRFRRCSWTVWRQSDRNEPDFRDLIQALPGHSHSLVSRGELSLEVRVAATDQEFDALWRICERHIGAPQLQLEIAIHVADAEDAATLPSARLEAGESIGGFTLLGILSIRGHGALPGAV